MRSGQSSALAWAVGVLALLLPNDSRGQVASTGAGDDYAKTSFVDLNKIAKQSALYVSAFAYELIDGTIDFDVEESVLMNLVSTNVLLDEDVYGSAIAFQPNMYRNKSLYCPYAYNCTGSTVSTCQTMDLVVAYNYTVEGTDWYLQPETNFNIDVSTNIEGVDHEGYWTSPYFDAGAGNVNMVTFSYPISFQSTFLGVATIDILVDKLCYGSQCEEHLKLLARMKNLCYGLGSVNLFIALGTLIWTVLARKNIIVKASQVPFLMLTSVGTLVSTMSIFLFTVESTEAAACQGWIWTYSFGWMLQMAPLVGKMKRCHEVFNNTLAGKNSGNGRKGNRNASIARTSLLIFVFVLIDAILLLAWSVKAPLSYVASTDGLEGSCTSSDATPFLLLVLLYHLAVLFYGSIMAYKVRNVSTVFAESRYISMAIFSNLQVLLLGACVLLLVFDDPVNGLFLRAGIVFLNDLSVQALLFGPKLYYWATNSVPNDGKVGTDILAGARAKKSSKVEPGSRYTPSATSTVTNITSKVTVPTSDK